MTKKTSKKTSSKAKAADFEQALTELEALVAKMEKGESSLEEAMADFQRGIELSRTCQATLKAAEQKVQILMEHGDQAELAPFETDE